MFRAPPLMLAAVHWLRLRRSRCLFLILCSPVLLPFFCIMSAAEVCFRLCCCCFRRRRRTKTPREDSEDERLRRCEEGRCGYQDDVEDEEVGLLQRYLEDQLILVGSVYECGDDDDDESGDADVGGFIYSSQTRTPLLA